MVDNTFYRPDNAWVGDFIPYYDEDEFKLFYLKNWRDNYREEFDKGWHLLGTDDFLDFDEYGACEIEGGTGSILEVDGTYHMFYCKFPSEDLQVACHATSDDLINWDPKPDDTFSANGKVYERGEFRDPHVFWHDEEEQYWMLISAQVAEGVSNRRGCVGLCVSDDLKDWEIREPLYAPGLHVGSHECADIFRWGDWWYLVYSNYTGTFRTFYRMSRSPSGPWRTPEHDTFDGRAFYAGKTCAEGPGRQLYTGDRRRFIFGWNPTKVEDLFDWNPDGYDGTDYNTWDWGGNLVVHELVQHDDGTLGVKLPGSFDRSFAGGPDLSFDTRVGDWKTENGSLVCKSPYSFSAAFAGVVSDPSAIRGSLSFEAGTRQLGLVLRAQDDLSRGYYFDLEPGRDRVVYRSHIMQTEEGGKAFPYDVEQERHITLSPDRRYEFTAVVDDSICELYLDDEVALSTRMYDLDTGRFGVYVRDGSAVFDGVEYSTPNHTGD